MSVKYSLLATCALLGACTMIPKYQRPAMPVQASWPTGAAYAPQVAAGQNAVVDWDHFYQDPLLRQAVTIALANNRDIKIAQAQVDAARDAFDISRATLFPSLNGASANDFGQENARTIGNRTGGTMYPRSYGLGLGVSAYEVDLWGRVRSLSASAYEQAMNSAYLRDAEQITVSSAVATAVMSWVADNEAVGVIQDILSSWQKSYQLVKARRDMGAGDDLDVAQAASSVDTAQRELEVYLRQRAQAFNQLQLLMGAPIDAEFKAALEQKKRLADLQDFPDVPAGLPASLLERRPDIRAQEAELLAANANIGAARAAFFPRIELTASYGTASSHLSGLFAGGMKAWSFAPDLTLPIFDAGRLSSQLHQAKAKRAQEIASYEKAIQEAFREVADALAGRGTYTQELAAQQSLEQDSQRQYDLSMARFHVGSSGYTAALVAQRSLFDAKLQLIQTELARRSNTITLYKALGGGWGADTALPKRPTNPLL